MHKHTYPQKNLELPRTLHEDRHKLEVVDVPIVTTSASFRSAIIKSSHEVSPDAQVDVVFSRAHFSMAVGVLQQAREMGLSAWFIDPVNYVSKQDWKKVASIVRIGRLMAYFPVIKRIKDFLDTFIRAKLPLGEAIAKPLLYATARVEKPIISFHYETGNVLAREGKRVIQVITDPHIRPQYLLEAGRKNMVFAAFDEETKKSFFEKAKDLRVEVEAERVVVTGPPVDPRIVRARRKKDAKQVLQRPLRLVITTGGLGQNKAEIKTCLQNIGEKIKKHEVRVLLYASTLQDYEKMYREIAASLGILPGRLEDNQASLRIVFASSIVGANQALIDRAFVWADGFVTKPSGDMAYDAVAAGCFLLTLSPWGEWEENIFNVFSAWGIARRADVEHFSQQLEELAKEGWFSRAVKNALEIDKIFLNGAKNIVDLQQKLSKVAL